MGSQVPRPALYLAFLVSGLTALVYQIVWSRYLTLLVGGTSVAQAIVLATFMGGLAFGNAFFGRRADRPGADRLRLYALLEVGIGLCCLLFPSLFTVVSRLYLALASIGGPDAGINHALRAALAAISMFLPCAFMGGTLPVLAKYVVDSMSGLGGRIGWLYFINTAGAVVGCVLGGFYIVEAWGLEAGMVAGSLLNLAIGGLFYFWGKRAAAATPAPAAAVDAAAAESADPAPQAEVEALAAPDAGYTDLQARVAFWGIAVAGGISMLYELTWTRVLTLSIGGTVHSFSTMLVSFISGIAMGSWAAGRLMRRPRNALALFGLCEVGIALSIVLPLRLYERLPYAFHRVGAWLAHTPDTYGLYLLLQVLLAAVVMVVPTTLIGAALPLASRVCVDRLDVLGRRVGSVFSVNTLGTVVGTLFTGFVLLPWLGVERTMLLGCTVSGLIGVTLLWAWRRERGGRPHAALADVFRVAPARQGPALWPAAAVAVGAAVLLAVLSPRWDPRLTQEALFRWGSRSYSSWKEFKDFAYTTQFLYARDGADGTVAIQQITPKHMALRVNGKPDASTGNDMITQLVVGHLPMLFHPQPRKAMVVGLGSGVSAASVLAHPGVHADVAEISPEVVEAAAYFKPWNGDVLHNPRMTLHVEDARQYLMLTRDRYDVIVSEPTNVWIPGVANLFTRDFYRVAHSRLLPGGLFAQWMQVYLAEPRMVASVIGTVRSEFPYVSAWLVGETDLILLAGDQRPTFDPAVFEARMAAIKPAVDLDVPDRGRLSIMQDPILFLAQQLGTGEGLDLEWPPGTVRVYEDTRPRLEFAAARAQFMSQFFNMTEELDERFTSVGSDPLFLAEYLRARPLDDAGRRQLLTRLEAAGRALDDMRVSLGTSLAVRNPDDTMLMLRLPEQAVARVAVLRHLGGRLDQPGTPDAGVCDAYVTVARNVFRLTRSVLDTPSVDDFEARTARCLAARPDETMKARVARTVAEAGASSVALRHIQELEQDGSFTRLPQKEAADLLVAGSLLLLSSGSYDRALPWAHRALLLDGSNTAAARIVLALAKRGFTLPAVAKAGATQ